MSSNDVLLLRISSICGILSPFIIFSMILIAINHAPWFSWTENALSDLGVEGISALLFNSSIIIGGILNTVFSISIINQYARSSIGKVGSYLYFLDAMFLSLIGIFPETYGLLHLYVSVGFFIFLPLSLLLISIHFFHYFSSYSWGFFTILIVVIAILPWSLSWSGEAIPEIISGLAGGVWSMFQGYTIIRRISEKN